MVNDALAEDFFWIGKVEVQFCCFNKVILMILALRMLKFQVCRCVSVGTYPENICVLCVANRFPPEESGCR